MCCSPHHFTDWAATHYHTPAWQMLIYGKERFILLLLHNIGTCKYAYLLQMLFLNDELCSAVKTNGKKC